MPGLPASMQESYRMGAGFMKQDWEVKHYSFYQNRECEFFPCHKGADEQNFNCLFCYCPLYVLGKECGGSPQYTKQGIKDCTGCMLPHQREQYGYVTGQFSRIAAAAASIHN